jgi:hypothetical protein
VTFCGVRNWQTLAALWADALLCNKKKISRAERSWTDPMNAPQGAIHYSFIQFCIYCFPLWNEFFVHYALRVKKNYQQVLDAGPLEFQFLWPRRCTTNPFRTLSLLFWDHRQNTRASSPIIILLKIFVCIGQRDNVLARYDSIFPLLRCQGVWNKTYTQLPLSQIQIARWPTVN